MVWQNGVAQHLTEQGGWDVSNDATDIFVSGNNVYIVGTELISKNERYIRVATLWRNGVVQQLCAGRGGSWLNVVFSVFVSGGNVYIAGLEENEEGVGIATLWRNGVLQRLSNERFHASAVFVVYR